MNRGDTSTTEEVPGEAAHTISTLIETFDFELGYKASRGLIQIYTGADIACHGIYFDDLRTYVVDLVNFWSLH